jgi:GNAT superfamily N-acetyltransferase
MNTEINNSSQCYGLYNVDNEQVAFIAIMHFPHPINKKIKRIHRFVVLPDYQGIGIGGIFLDSIADIYKGFDVRIVTSAKNLIHKLDKSKKWRLINWGIKKGGNKTEIKSLSKSHRKIKTATFKYIFR